MKAKALLATTVFLLSACTSQDPGKLAGDWRVTSENNWVLTFERGRVVADGMTVNVKYESTQNGMKVTMLSDAGSPTKVVNYEFIGPDRIKSDNSTLERMAAL